MSVQALAAVIESELYLGATYGILLSLANHADPDGYAYIGYQRMAEEARCDERHAKRVIKAITVDVKRNPDVWPDPGGHEAALAAAPVWRLSEQGGPRGTNEYQINMTLFRDAREAAEKRRRDRRAGRSKKPPEKGVTSDAPGPEKGVTSDAPGPEKGVTSDAPGPEKGVTSDAPGPEKGVTSDADEPSKMGVTSEMGVTSDARGGDSRSHPRGDIRSHPNRPSEGTEARAREALAMADAGAAGTVFCSAGGVSGAIQGGVGVAVQGAADCAPGCISPDTGSPGEPAAQWREVRRLAKARFGAARYASDLCRLRAEGAAVLAVSRFDVATLARAYGPFFKEFGFDAVRSPDGAEVKL